jgi:phospholipase A1
VNFRGPALAPLLLAAAGSAFGQETLFQKCVTIDDASDRLNCYDSASGRSQYVESTKAKETQALLPYKWEQRLLADAARAPFTLEPYQPTYVVASYLSSFNHAPYDAFDPKNELSQYEVKLGFSLQTKLADDLFGNNGDIWMSYTQTSYWQVFATDISSPFRETDYNPEMRLSILTTWDLFGMTLRTVDLGIRHDSNGQASTLSRSWNRVFANLQLTRGSLILEVRPWLAFGDLSDNPDIEDYYGHFDLRAAWEHDKQLFSITLRNPLDHRFGAELSWSTPISGRLRGLVQWYHGYGENLIDYNHKNNRVSLGILLTDWL